MSMWVVDTCVIIDVLSGDNAFSMKSADAIDAKRAEGLVVAPITYVELAPSFLGDVAKQDMVLSDLGIELDFAGSRGAVLPASLSRFCNFCFCFRRFAIEFLSRIWYNVFRNAWNAHKIGCRESQALRYAARKQRCCGWKSLAEKTTSSQNVAFLFRVGGGVLIAGMEEKAR